MFETRQFVVMSFETATEVQIAKARGESIQAAPLTPSRAGDRALETMSQPPFCCHQAGVLYDLPIGIHITRARAFSRRYSQHSGIDIAFADDAAVRTNLTQMLNEMMAFFR